MEQSLAAFPVTTLLAEDWASLVTTSGLFAIGALVFVHRPRDPAAQLLMVVGAAFLPGSLWRWMGVNDLVAGSLVAWNAVIQPLYYLGLTAFAAFAIVYPTPPALLVRHARLAVALLVAPAAIGTVILVAAHLSGEPMVAWMAWTGSLESITIAVCFAVIAVGAPLHLWTLRRTPGATRYLLLVGALGGSAIAWSLVYVIPSLLFGEPLLPWSSGALFGVPIVAALGIGVLRLDLFEIEPVINRALVYGTLTAIIALVYVVAVGGTVLFAREQFGFAAALVVTAIVVLGAEPVRDALQRTANRLMYGDRDDPYRALSRLGARIQASLVPADILAAVVDVVTDALRVPYAAVELEDMQGGALIAERGLRREPTMRVPLIHQGQRVGQLILAPRDGGMGRREERLLADLARQAGPAAYAARTNLELQRSRERLVAAREEERRRLRRDLHDGLGPALAGSRLQLQAALAALPAESEQAAEILRRVEVETLEAIGEVRRMARELRPPVLDELGLAEAIRERATDFAADGRLRIKVDVPAELPKLPAAVEVAAYRIVLEALANVVHHAEAHHCQIRVDVGDDLRVEVRDDGRGIAAQATNGVGLRSMRERASELGGSVDIGPNGERGTAVVARLPFEGVAGA